MNSIREFLIANVKEKYIVDEIFKLKKKFELAQKYSILRKKYKKNIWWYISMSSEIDEDFIREYQDYVNWKVITSHQKLSNEFIIEFQDKVNWKYLLVGRGERIQGGINSDFLIAVEKHIEIWSPFLQILPFDFIKKIQCKINWPFISKYEKLSEDFIREFKDKVDWRRMSKYQKMSEDFIEEHIEYIWWGWISGRILSENFLRKYQEYICWVNVSYKHLSEDFIREMQDKVIWAYVFLDKTNMSKEFISEFQDRNIPVEYISDDEFDSDYDYYSD